MLAVIGEPMTDNDLLLYMIGGLRPRYNSCVASLNMREVKPSLSTLHCLLGGYDHMLHKKSSFDQSMMI